MARLGIYRSMHNVRPGEQHRPRREVELEAAAIAFLRLCDVEVGSAWAGDRLNDLRRRMESELQLLKSYATEGECRALGRTRVDDEVRARIAERLSGDVRYQAVKQFVELAREAENALMTLVLSE